jgi:hypothetical protein
VNIQVQLPIKDELQWQDHYLRKAFMTRTDVAHRDEWDKCISFNTTYPIGSIVKSLDGVTFTISQPAHVITGLIPISYFVAKERTHPIRLSDLQP